jgi:hypothetical protein
VRGVAESLRRGFRFVLLAAAALVVVGAGSQVQAAAPPARKSFRDLVWKPFRLANTAVSVPPSASAVADGGELLGQAAAEGRHACEEA